MMLFCKNKPDRFGTGRISPLILLLLVLFPLFSGCSMGVRKDIAGNLSYLEILSDWTRDGRIYDGIDLSLLVYATYKGREYREAFVKEYASRYSFTANQRDRLITSEKAGLRESEDFLLIASTSNDTYNDFDKDKSIWSIYLEDDDGNRQYPFEIKSIHRDSLMLKGFYPQMNRWSRAYLVRFSKYDDSGKNIFLKGDSALFKLVFTGVLGRTELVWR